MSSPSAANSNVFISYSHREDGPKWKARLLKHIDVFEKIHFLDVRADGSTGNSRPSGVKHSELTFHP
jgi:hypothetical protein